MNDDEMKEVEDDLFNALEEDEMRDNPYQRGYESLMGASEKNRSKEESRERVSMKQEPRKPNPLEEAEKIERAINKPFEIQNFVVSMKLGSFIDMLNEQMDSFQVRAGSDATNLNVLDLRMRKEESGGILVDLRMGEEE